MLNTIHGGPPPGNAEILHVVGSDPGIAIPDLVLWLFVATAAATYVTGWMRLRHDPRLAPRGRLGAYVAAVAILVVALVGPLDQAADRGLAAHMVQHMLLVMAAPPLLLAARPYAIGFWGLPVGARRVMARVLAQGRPVRLGLTAFTPLAAFAATALVHVVWHDPRLYDAAIRNGALHALEHVMFFGTALAWWWHGLRAPPRFHPRLAVGFRTAYFMGMAPVAMLIGMFIAFAPEPLYPTYALEAALHRTDALADQQMGGAILWVMGGMMYLLVGLAALASDLSRQERLAKLGPDKYALGNAVSETLPPSAAATPTPVRSAAG